MHHRTHTQVLLTSLLLVAPLACDELDPELDHELGDELDELDDELDVSFRNGGLTTGRRLNTHNGGFIEYDTLPLNGSDHEGIWLLGVDYHPSGVESPGPSIPVDIPTIDVVDTELRATTVEGQPLAHTDFGQTEWHVLTPNGEIDLRVEATRDPETWTALYQFRWRPHGSGEAFLHNCLMPGEPQLTTAAVYRDIDVHPDGSITPLPERLYIGCIAGAVGKASLFGYRPEIGSFALQQIAIGNDPVHAFSAATRMIRADYCGDGTSFTQTGTPIYVQDKVIINDGPSGLFVWPGPQNEAVWGLDGAWCVDLPRIHPWWWTQPTCNGVPLPSCGPDVHTWFWFSPALFRTDSDP
ncbi:MAG: hypothetical protein KDK70_13645 [Myxococcales bacterium]|nr:hypothetical protein [Myxococcales bacterium]